MINAYLILINIIAFAVYGLDKYKAVHNKWRIPESQLLLLAALGGTAGALLGMQFFHHKTRKPQFRYGVPLILAVQLSLYYLL